jgi:hypothetical protein
MPFAMGCFKKSMRRKGQGQLFITMRISGMNYVHKDDITPLECMRITELLILGSSGSDPYGPWRRIVEHKLERHFAQVLCIIMNAYYEKKDMLYVWHEILAPVVLEKDYFNSRNTNPAVPNVRRIIC